MEELENEISTQEEENTVSLASAQALADALTKIEAYTPTTWVDNSSPDIDAEHLNKPEQAIKRVTDALNSAVDVIKDLQSQITKNSGAISDVNNNLSKAIISSDLFADYSSPTFVRWNYKTANTPYKAGLTYGQEGFALVFGSVSGWHTVISWLKGGRNMWAHYVSEGTDYGWSEYAQKSDLTGLDAALSIREENGGVIVSFSSKDSKYGIYIGVGPNGVNANYKINGEWKKAIIIATKS